jgi:hypothetical protein
MEDEFLYELREGSYTDMTGHLLNSATTQRRGCPTYYI